MTTVSMNRGDTSKLTITLKDTSDIQDFNGYTVLLTMKQQLDADNLDELAAIKKSVVVSTPLTTSVDFDLAHDDTLVPGAIYNSNIRIVKNTDQEVLSSTNFIIKMELGATQRIV